MSNHLATCFTPANLNTLTLKNRIIKSATFEGMTPNGVPNARFRQFHSDIARGGTAMTTLAYCASEPDGRIHANMMFMDEQLRQPLTAIIDELHGLGTKVSGQLADRKSTRLNSSH